MQRNYNYERDFPEGNGWHGQCVRHSWFDSPEYELNFKGVVIESTEYVFEKGRFKGKTLQEAFDYDCRGIYQYINFGFIHLSIGCLSDLTCTEKQLLNLQVITDSKLLFTEVQNLDDEIFTSPFASSFQGKTLSELFAEHTEYIMRILRLAINQRIGMYKGSSIATNHCSELLGEDVISTLDTFIYGLNDNSVKNKLSTLKTELEDYERDKLEYQQYLDSLEY